MSIDVHARASALARPCRLLVLLVSVVGLLAAGCGEDDGEEATRANADGAPVIEVLNAGAEPRRALELKVSPGDEAVSGMEMDMSIARTLDGNAERKVEMPTLGFQLSTTVEEVDADEITASFEYQAVEVADDGGDPALAAQLEVAVAALEEVRGRLIFAPNGALIDGEVDAPEGPDSSLRGMLDQLEQQLTSMAQPFPNQPVGVGAKWSVTSDLELGGIGGEQRATYTLKQLDGDRYALGFDIEQTMRPGPIEDGTTAGASAELISGETSGTGRIEGSLSSPLPLRSTGAITGQQEMEITAGGETQRLELEMDIEVELEPAS